MPRQLNKQPFCGWCGSKIDLASTWMRKCPDCGYRDYLNPKPCSSVIIQHNHKVLLVKRAVEPGEGQYDLPGGFMDMTDISMEAAAYRELQEEVGLSPKDISPLTYVGSGVNPYTWQDAELLCACFFYSTKLDSPDTLRLNTKENSNFLWISRDDLPTTKLAWDIDRQMLTKFFEEQA